MLNIIEFLTEDHKNGPFNVVGKKFRTRACDRVCLAGQQCRPPYKVRTQEVTHQTGLDGICR